MCVRVCGRLYVRLCDLLPVVRACVGELRAVSVNEINDCQYSVNINYDGVMDSEFLVLLALTWAATG